jgi:hypothetical protein
MPTRVQTFNSKSDSSCVITVSRPPSVEVTRERLTPGSKRSPGTSGRELDSEVSSANVSTNFVPSRFGRID